MAQAAEQMTRAANVIDESLTRHQRFLLDLVERLEALAENTKRIDPSTFRMR